MAVKRGWCSETSEPRCFGVSVRSRAGQRGRKSRLDVKGESRGVDGLGGADCFVLGAVVH